MRVKKTKEKNYIDLQYKKYKMKQLRLKDWKIEKQFDWKKPKWRQGISSPQSHLDSKL